MAEVIVLTITLTLVVLVPLWGWLRWRRHVVFTAGAKCMSEEWMKEHVYRDGVTRGD